MNKYLLIVIAILAGSLTISIKLYKGKAKECDRLSNNQNSLLTEIEHYKISDGRNVAAIEALTLSKKEIQQHKKDLETLCDQLKIKVKRLQSEITAVTEAKYNVEPTIIERIVTRDSVVYRTERVAYFADKWLKFEYSDNPPRAHIEVKDSLTFIAHRVPKKFLFIKYGTKSIRLETISHNPYSQITALEYIELKK